LSYILIEIQALHAKIRVKEGLKLAREGVENMRGEGATKGIRRCERR